MRICEPLGLGLFYKGFVLCDSAFIGLQFSQPFIYISIATLAFEDIGKHRLAFYFFGICKCFDLVVFNVLPRAKGFIAELEGRVDSFYGSKL